MSVTIMRLLNIRALSLKIYVTTISEITIRANTKKLKWGGDETE